MSKWTNWLYKMYTKRLEYEISKSDTPNHIGVILDGNRRWAVREKFTKATGHTKGADVVERLINWCEEFGINIITLYILSSENLGRDDKEVNHIYDVILGKLENIYKDEQIHTRKIRIKAIGRIDEMPKDIREILEKLDKATVGYDGIFLNLALAYGGQNEIIDAIKKIGTKIKEGSLEIDDIDKDVIESNLYTAYLPQSSPDMILRTAREKRLSGFLLWQSAYSELVFIDIFWPEFRKIDLMRAIRMYQKRKRRMGM